MEASLSLSIVSRLVRAKDITRDIDQRFEGKLARNCWVIEGGDITVGDEVHLVRGRACAESAAAAVCADSPNHDRSRSQGESDAL